ncbi:MAG: MarR family winged helix-turn-helix transcriptional regulator [Armatimonadota bacterium]
MNVIETILTQRALEGAPCDDLSLSQWGGMLFIQRHENCAIRELAEGLKVSHPAAVKLVERLVRKGLIDRHESATDRRVVELSLSTCGRRCVDHVRDQRAQSLERIVSQMKPEDAEALLIGIQGFVQASLVDQATVDAVCLHCGIEHVKECLLSQAQDELTHVERVSV